MGKPTRKFTIGLDLDGVCYQFDSTARYMLRQRIIARGDLVPDGLYEPSRHWDWISEQVSPADWKWLWTDGVREGLFRYGHAVRGSIEGVQALTRLGDVITITHRPAEAVRDTLAWVTLMFDRAPMAGLVIQSNGQKKSEVIPTPDVYIDDAAHNADDVLDNTDSDIVLLNQPWNQGYYGGPSRLRSSRLFRAANWDSVVSTVGVLRKI